MLNTNGFMRMLAGLLLAGGRLAAETGIAADADAALAAVPSVAIILDSFVNVEYRYRPDLDAWRTTREVIALTLAEWFAAVKPGMTVEDGTPAELRRWLAELAARPRPGRDLEVLYVAAHQSRNAELFFGQQRQPLGWDELLAGIPAPARPEARLVILDTCHAAAVKQVLAWQQGLGPLTVCAADAGERTYIFHFNRRQPIDLRKRFPKADAWLRERLPADWDGSISFFGLMWVLTYLHEARSAADREGLVQFVEQVQETGANFARDHHRKHSSTIVTLP